jgi:hypothetical protein
MSKEKPNLFEENFKKKVLKNALGLLGQFLSKDKLDSIEKDAIENIKYICENNPGKSLFLCPVIEGEHLHLVAGLLIQCDDGTIRVDKQIPFDFAGKKLDSLPVKELMNDVLSNKIDIFKFAETMKQKELPSKTEEVE